MGVETEVNAASEKSNKVQGADAQFRASIIQELDRVLASRFFKNSQRSRQFLEYIVNCKLDGRADDLKERTIGTEVFHRPPDYSTGEDPVVRVQAGEVRRRLEQFYQSDDGQPAVRIELATGSYAPHFHPRAPHVTAQPETPSPTQTRSTQMLRKRTAVFLGLICLIAAILAVSWWARAHEENQRISVTNQFWGPALASQQPVLLCLAKPVFYRPSLELYRAYSNSHPGTFQTEVERSNRALPLDPKTKIDWGQLSPYPDYGVAVGDVEAVVKVSGLLGSLAKPIQIRIGDRYTVEDLRSSPSALIGAFNNKWTMQITHGLYFEFVESADGALSIHENSPGGQVWQVVYGKSNEMKRDFALVARLLDSNNGQFTIVAAGITGSGTQAAGEFVSKPEILEKALKSVPAGWQNKNVEFVLQTDLTDSVAGPPTVLAYHTW